MLFERFLTIFVTLALAVSNIRAADLSVADVVVSPGATATVVVSGNIAGESTFAVNIYLEIVPQDGNTGTVVFTPEPPVDIVQLGDPWPATGLFSGYDTLSTFSSVLNGSLDDNGTWVPGPVTYSGPLSGFPVQASPCATGVWDVKLSTFVDDSNWEGLTTTLIAGTIVIVPCSVDSDCDDADLCTDDVCADGECTSTLDTTDSDDDGIPDACDECPNTAAGAGVDSEGCPPVVPADTDRDGDLDLDDFANVVRCLTGPATLLGDPTCDGTDTDEDGDLDLEDIAALHPCFSGAGVATYPGCVASR